MLQKTVRAVAGTVAVLFIAISLAGMAGVWWVDRRATEIALKAFSLVESAAAVPLTYLAQVPAGLAPALPTSTFALVFVLPYVVTAGLAYIAPRIIHHLGK